MAAPAASTTVTGTVTGHVICGDTYVPARMASVVLEPVVDPDSSKPQTESMNGNSAPTTTVAETSLDGSFVIPHVKPGDYYVIAEKEGYLSARSLLSREDLNHPDDQAKKLIAQLLRTVTVVGNSTSNADVILARGATIAGTIRFDDGTPYDGAYLVLMRKDKDGKWNWYRTNMLRGESTSGMTDDRGQYRVIGLPAGEYLLSTTLSLHEVEFQGHLLGGNGGGSSTREVYQMQVFFGDVLRPRDAKTIKVGDGEQSGGNDILLRLANLHSVSGVLVDSVTGNPVNEGMVTISYPDDHTRLVQTMVNTDDGAFHFPYVPEGSYTLQAYAREVTRTEVPNYCPAGQQCSPATSIQEKTVQEYKEASQPLVFTNDISGVTVTVTPKPPRKEGQPTQ